MFHTDFSPDSGAAIACFSVDDRVDPAVLASDPKAVDIQFLPKPQPRTTLLTRDDVVRYLVATVTTLPVFGCRNRSVPTFRTHTRISVFNRQSSYLRQRRKPLVDPYPRIGQGQNHSFSGLLRY